MNIAQEKVFGFYGLYHCMDVRVNVDQVLSADLL